MFVFVFTVIIFILVYVLKSDIINQGHCTSTCHVKKFTLVHSLEFVDTKKKIFNPSIAFSGTHTVIAARYTNATMKNLQMYLANKLFKNKYESSIAIFNIDNTKNVTHLHLSKYPLEDPRILKVRNGWCIIAAEYKSATDIYPVLFRFNKTFSRSIRVDFKRETYHSPYSIQKNWCPFIHNGKIAIHTDTSPWSVYYINKHGSLHFLVSSSIEGISERDGFTRCSTGWKRFSSSTYLCGLHHKVYDPIFKKFATIRCVLVEIDMKTLLPLRKSPPFCIENKDKGHHYIQFLSGLEIIKNEVVFTLGMGDYCIAVYKASLATVDKMLTIPL